MSGPLGVGIGGGGSGTAPTSYPYLGIGSDGTLSAEVDVQALQLVNEFKGFPACVAPDADLVTLNLWWDDLSTPTTKCTFVDLAGEAGITETWEHALKCVGDSSGDGFYQRWTYAEEARVKSGRKFSALAAVWAPAGRIVTIALTTSTPTTVSAPTTTTGAWQIIAAENLTLDGTYVDFNASIDGAGTFYVVPLGANIGARALPLPPRPLRYVEALAAGAIVAGVDPGGAGWTDVDLTATTSPLAVMAQVLALYLNSTTAGRYLRIRRNGDTSDDIPFEITRNPTNAANHYVASKIVGLDDANIFEYDTNGAAGETESVYLGVPAYWEWA